MKKLRNFFYQAAAVMFAVVMMQSCSCSGESVESRIDKVVSDDADLVVTGNIARALDELDIKVKGGHLVLPDYMMSLIENMTPGMVNQVDETLNKFEGVEYSSFVFATEFTKGGMNGVISFGVTDADKLYDFITDMGGVVVKSKVGDYTTIGDGRFDILIKGKDAFVVMKNNRWLAGEQAAERIEKILEEAKEDPIDSWKKDYLAATGIYSMWISADMIKETSPYDWKDIKATLGQLPGVDVDDLSFGLRLDLDGDAAKGNLTIFDDDKVMKAPIAGQQDAELLKYVTDSDLLVVGGAVNKAAINLARMVGNQQIDEQLEYYQDTYVDAYMTDSLATEADDFGYQSVDNTSVNQLKATRQLLNTLADCAEGSGIFACGFDKNLSLGDLQSSRAFKSVHFLFAAKCKDGKAATVVESLKALMGQQPGQIDVVDTQKGFVASSKGDAMKLYVEADGNNIVVADAPVTTTGNKNFNAGLFKNTWLAGQLFLPKDMAVLEAFDVPCDVNVTLTADQMSFDVEMSFPGSKLKFVPTIFDIVKKATGF